MAIESVISGCISGIFGTETPSSPPGDYEGDSNIPGLTLTAAENGANWDWTVTGDPNYNGVYPVPTTTLESGVPVILKDLWKDEASSTTTSTVIFPSLMIYPATDPVPGVSRTWKIGGRVNAETSTTIAHIDGDTIKVEESFTNSAGTDTTGEITVTAPASVIGTDTNKILYLKPSGIVHTGDGTTVTEWSDETGNMDFLRDATYYNDVTYDATEDAVLFTAEADTYTVPVCGLVTSSTDQLAKAVHDGGAYTAFFVIKNDYNQLGSSQTAAAYIYAASQTRNNFSNVLNTVQCSLYSYGGPGSRLRVQNRVFSNAYRSDVQSIGGGVMKRLIRLDVDQSNYTFTRIDDPNSRVQMQTNTVSAANFVDETTLNHMVVGYNFAGHIYSIYATTETNSTTLTAIEKELLNLHGMMEPI